VSRTPDSMIRIDSAPSELRPARSPTVAREAQLTGPSAAVLGPPASEGRGRPEPGPLLQLANEIRRLHKQAIGRGPADVRVLPAGPVVLVLLEGTLTPAETSLLRIGRHDCVLTARHALYEALEPDLRTIVERGLGRRTVGFMPGVDIIRDITSLVVTIDVEAGIDVAEPRSALQGSSIGAG
jgi:uncharacterized protein YbcI